MEREVVQPELVAYGNALAGIESLPAYYIAHALTRLGWVFQPGDRFETPLLQTALGVAEQHSRLLGRLLEILADQGVLLCAGRQWEVLKGLTVADPRAIFRSGFAEVRRGTSRVRDARPLRVSAGGGALSGRLDPLQLLFPDGDLASVSSLYRDSPGCVAMNRLLREAVARIVEEWPGTRPLRVLEVGAGTGAATGSVLPVLPPDQTVYVFSDISRRFLTLARSVFFGFSFVRYEILDIERSPAEQGFAGREFDLVIASNVLHASSDLRQALRHVRGLLRQGGLLLLLENTAPAKWVDLVWGLTVGWWRFSDIDLRPSYPLLSEPQWRALLKGLGFSSVESVAPDARRHEMLSGQALIIAQRDGSDTTVPARRDSAWLIFADEGGLGENLASAFAASGIPSAVVHRGRCFLRRGKTFAVDPTSFDDYRRLLDHYSGEDGPTLGGVVHLWGLDATKTDRLGTAALTSNSLDLSGSVLFLAQALSVAALRGSPRLWLVTRAAQPVGAGRAGLELAQATMCGVGKVITLEHPENWGGMIDLDPEPMPGDAAVLMAELLAPENEDQIAFRTDRRFVARVVRMSPRPRLSRPVARTASTSSSEGSVRSDWRRPAGLSAGALVTSR